MLLMQQKKRRERNQMLGNIKHYSSFRKFDNNFSKKLLDVTRHSHKKIKAHKEKLLIGSFPPKIRKAVIKHTLENSLKNWDTLKFFPYEFIEKLFLLMKRVVIEKGEIVCSYDDFCEEFFIVEEGSLLMIKKGDKEGDVLKNGN